MSREMIFVELTVHGLAVDPQGKSPVLLLRDSRSRILLPILIGEFEAKSILAELESRRAARPRTHDLATSLVGELGGRILSVEIYRLHKGTFLARLCIRTADGAEVRVECRASDGIAMALRSDAPIRVETEVLTAAHPLDGAEVDPSESSVGFVANDDAQGKTRLLAELAEMEPSDFGEFEM